MLLILLSALLPVPAGGDPYPTLDGFRIDGSAIVGTEIRAVAVQPWDGKIIIGGVFTVNGAVTRQNLARLNTDGTLDAAFTCSANAPVNSIVIQPDPSDPAVPEKSFLLIGGSFGSITAANGLGVRVSQTRNGLARLKSLDGTLDDAFDPSKDAGTVISAIALLPDTHSILVGGAFSQMASTSCSNIAAISDTGGAYLNNFSGGVTGGDVYAVLVQGGRIVLGGDFLAPSKFLARFYANGNPDNAFNASPDAAVRSLALQPDGKILLGGDFTHMTASNYPLGKERNHLARLKTDLSLDNFDPSADGRVASIVQQPDGKILVAGSFTRILQPASHNPPDGTFVGPAVIRNRVARLNPDGTLDPGINPDADAVVAAIALQPDGKFLVGGNFAAIGGKSLALLARFYPYGTLDDDVSAVGPNIASTGSNMVFALAMQPDGMVTIGGSFESVWSAKRLGIARLNPDWSLASDAAFNPMLEVNNPIVAFAPRPDGKTIVGGKFTDAAFLVDKNGNLDLPFNQNVHNLVAGAGARETLAMALLRPGTLLPDGERLDDGMVYLGGDFGNGVRLVRLKSSGEKDASFAAPTGTYEWGGSTYTDEVRSIVIQPDNKIIIGTATGTVMRLKTDGAIDPDFTVQTMADGQINSLLLQSDGQILVVGRFFEDSTLNPAVAHPDANILRLNNGRSGFGDGTIDGRLIVKTNLTGSLGIIRGIALQADGSMLVSGDFDEVVDNGVPIIRDNVAHLSSTGKLDLTFDLGTFDYSSSTNKVNFIRLQADGKLIVGGGFTSMYYSDENKTILTRFANGWATQELSVSSDGDKVTWLRGGSGPELWRVSIEYSADAHAAVPSWSYLGDAHRINLGYGLPSKGWQLNGLNLGARGTSGYLRATGYVAGENGSAGSLVESVRLYELVPTAKQQQTIGFTISDKNYGDDGFYPSGTASSGLPVSYASSNSAVAVVVNGKIEIIGSGDTVITASQPGNGTFQPATDVSRNFTVNKKELTVTADSKSRAYSTPDPTLTASYQGFVKGETRAAISGAPALSSAATQASPAGNYPIVAGLGNLWAKNYRFVLINGNLSVYRSCQEIVFPPIGERTFGDPPVAMGASSCSGLGIGFTSSNPHVAEISGNVLTITGAGSAVITASQGGNNNLDKAPDVSQTIIVHKSGQVLNFPPLSRKMLGDPPFSLKATASSGLPVNYLSSDTEVATIGGGIVTMVGAGTTVITAMQAGNANFNAALAVSEPLSISQEAIPPLLTLSTLSSGDVTADPVLNIMGTASDASGIASLTVGGADLTSRAQLFSSAVALGSRDNSVSVIAKDGAGNKTTRTLSIVLDAAGPAIELTAPADNSVTNDAYLTASGTVTPGSAVTMGVNGGSRQSLTVTEGGFSGGGYLEDGVNTVEFCAALSGRASKVKRSVTLAPGKPFVAITEPVEDIRTEAETITISGVAGAQGSEVQVVIDADGTIFKPSVQAGVFHQQLVLSRTGQIRITASAADSSGNLSVAQRNIIRIGKIMGDLNGDGRADIQDALALLRISLGLDAVTAQALAHGDVAPLVDGVPRPDGKIDVGDVLVLLRKIVGLVDF